MPDPNLRETKPPNITGERDLDFVLANVRDVAALDALWTRANKDVPKWLEQVVRSVLAEDCAGMLRELGLHTGVHDKTNESFWSRNGDNPRVEPAFFVWVPPNLDWLVRDSGETLHVYLWCYEGPALDRWVNRAEKHRHELTRRGFRVLAHAQADGVFGGRTLLSRNIDNVFEAAQPSGTSVRRLLAQSIEEFTRRALPFVANALPSSARDQAGTTRADSRKARGG